MDLGRHHQGIRPNPDLARGLWNGLDHSKVFSGCSPIGCQERWISGKIGVFDPAFLLIRTFCLLLTAFTLFSLENQLKTDCILGLVRHGLRGLGCGSLPALRSLFARTCAQCQVSISHRMLHDLDDCYFRYRIGFRKRRYHGHSFLGMHHNGPCGFDNGELRFSRSILIHFSSLTVRLHGHEHVYRSQERGH